MEVAIRPNTNNNHGKGWNKFVIFKMMKLMTPND